MRRQTAIRRDDVNEKKSAFPTGPTIATLGAPPVPPMGVPWDAKALKGRECQTCACYFEQANAENPLLIQGFCRRLPAEMAKVRLMEKRTDRQGNVVMRDGQPVLQPNEVTGYLFKPTRREGTCFDGWRSLETLPGERAIDATIRLFRDRLEPVLKDIPPQLQPFLQALFGLDTGETKN